MTGPIPGMVISRLAVSSLLPPVDRLDGFVERVNLPDERSEGEAHAVGNHDLAVLIDAAVDQLLERIRVRSPLRGDNADLRQMAAQGVERRRALPDQQLADAMAHQRGLVLDRAYRNEALARPPFRLADRRRVDCVALVAPDIGLHVRRRNELHREAERLQLPPPVMRRGTGLHRHHAPRKRVEKLQKRSAIDRASNDNLTRRIDRVNPEDPLGQIKPDARDTRCIDDRLAHGRPPF